MARRKRGKNGQVSFDKKGNSYEARITVKLNGKSVRKSFSNKDKREAERRALNFKMEAARNQVIDTSKGSGKVTVSLWKRDVRHDLFQGHYCQCCVSTDGINNHSIVETLGHTVDQIAELKDPSGQTVGKVKMLFSEF